MSTLKITLALLAVSCAGLTGCMRGGVSDAPPVHLVLDMDFQHKLKAQSHIEFEGWPDGRSSRLPVHDPVSTDPLGKTLVVARGSLPNADLSHKDASGAFKKQNPLPLTHKFTVLGKPVATIDRGKERFDIHCSICHGTTGLGGNGPTGNGLAGRHWPVAIPSFHFAEGKDNRVANLTDGELFDVITYGKNTMPAYGARLSVEDRWAIVHYVRALQSLSK